MRIGATRWIVDAGQDARYAARAWRRSPGFAAAALLTLTLGIGATTAVFSVVYGILLRPLPYPAADRLVRVWEEHPGGITAAGNRWISNRTYFAWLDHPRTIDVLGGYGGYETTVRIADDDVRLFGAEVSPALLGALGARPIQGRLFAAEDSEEGNNRVLMLSEDLWRTRFASDAGVIGRSLMVDGEPHTIVGVLDGDFIFPDRRARYWSPYSVERVSTDPARSERTRGLSAIARLAPGATAAQVEAEGTAAARSVPVTSITQLLFGKGGPPVVHARPLVSDITRDAQPALLVFAAAVGCVLLIACVNVSNLCLARGVARQRELTFRAALGAGRGRLARQLLTESLLLSVAGGVLGLAFAAVLIRLTTALAPIRLPRLEAVRLDASVMAFTAAVSIVAAVMSGLIPSFRGTRFGLAESLRGGDGATAGGFRGRAGARVRDALLAAEAAFTVMLLVGALLLARSFVRLTQVDAGYTADRVLTARLLMPREADDQRSDRFIETLLARLRALPGVVAAGAGSMMPMTTGTAIVPFRMPDTGAGVPVDNRTVSYVVTPGYAEALRLRLRDGRFLSDQDARPGSRAMIVNDEFVRRYRIAAPVIGRRFQNVLPSDANVTTEIVGVVAPVLKDGNDRQPQPEAYMTHGPWGRRIQGAINLTVRASGAPERLAGAVRAEIRATDPSVSIERIETLVDQVSASMAQPRFAATVVVAFAAVALALAAVGLYGVLAYTVSQRRRELGVRAALGASRGRLVGLVLRQGLGVTTIGVAIGLAGAAGLTRLMQSQLFGVTPLDLPSFVLAGCALVGVAIVACVVPASRAAAVAPADALRCE
jgi:putative ABC transport system permease protein